MKKKNIECDEDSENEFDVDEPEELQGGSDDEEWTPGKKEVGGRRQSSRLRTAKKPRLTEPTTSEEDDLDDDFDDESSDESNKRKGARGKGRATKIIRKQPVQQQVTSPPQNIVRTEATSTTPEKEFTSGAFVVLKTDFHSKDDPPIWKIDGKALLQKYVPFNQEGKTLYKNTSTYSGWSLSNKEQYYPAPVAFKSQDKKEIIIEFLRENVKEDADDD